jgi:hypothetical protein
MEKHELELPAVATLFAATLYLATRYAKSGRPLFCHTVVQQLDLIAHHPDPSVPKSIRMICRKLSAEWQRMAISGDQDSHVEAVMRYADGQALH